MTNDQKREPTPVDTIAEEWVDTQLELYPEFHVWLGRPGREGEYADYSPAGAEHTIAKVKETLARIEAAEPVDEIDRITQMDLARELRLAVEKHEAGFAQRDLNVIASPSQELRDIFDLVPTDTEDDWANVAKRLHNLPAAMDGYIETLRSGIRNGNVPAIRQVKEIITQANKQVADSGFFFQLAANANDRLESGSLPDSLQGDLDAGAQASANA